jgi:galactokinase/mevalonate kinase-like predicted kinase
MFMNQEELKKFTSWLGKRSYAVRVERLGIERIREIARKNGAKGGRPRKDTKGASSERI